MSTHPALREESLLLAECSVQRTRRGGPGGQHRNKVDSAIVITHMPSGIIGQASERRSQHDNREMALARLRVNLALGVRLPVEPDQEPSELWASRTGGRKISCNVRHQDFPGLLAEAMDFIVFHEFDVSSAAKQLKVSTSQLIKFLKAESVALEAVNRERTARELHRLK